MGFAINKLWAAPELNPYNKKARSIPILNPVNQYGRVFFFSWMGFFIAFWSWYAFPPLLSKSIKADMHLSQNEIANSNIIALTATLLVRAVAGPMCDHIGPRLTFASLLFVGSIPTALAGTAHNAMGLYFIRFFVGILGGTFVPCQVWTTGFFDKNVVGTANALVGGWGNSGGGITYFVMPAIYDSLKNDRGLSSHVSWRVSFIVPFILITTVALGLLLLTDDTPTGKWADRSAVVQNARSTHQTVVSTTGGLDEKPAINGSVSSGDEKKNTIPPTGDVESGTGDVQVIDGYQHEVVQKPTLKESMKVMLSPQTLMLCFCYFNSFGAELAINSILGAYYLKNFPYLGQTQSGRWAAMFGLLNVVTRPLGGFIADKIYVATNGSLWAKKLWINFVGVVAGLMCIVIGKVNSHDQDTMIGLVALMAIFLEAGNGANFALVPHIHPHANGILSGIVGATGNFGGVIYAIIFRYNHTDYAKVFWIIGIMMIIMNLMFVWVQPIPKGQIGGR
ncbi:major facilitator superfamily domain-containing protein [Ampelomyces quisqualis]|uniref:Nitrate/nitrite transporter n=1 Tax=Ampelomyces quisqualis TaxID=50730 RepID=A0A6A5QQ74_AMPQU|nr:major facilitator superfamily domain-containing protein [Ampelomyces quisqualis]